MKIEEDFVSESHSLIESWQSLKDNLLSCLSLLFDTDESKINEDFLQLSELLEAKNLFINRTELKGSNATWESLVSWSDEATTPGINGEVELQMML